MLQGRVIQQLDATASQADPAALLKRLEVT